MVRAILPRPNRFKPPGPRLAPADQPRLFSVVEHVAQRTQQAVPRYVYLIPGVNAFVGKRGGFMGIGGRRVLGLGLPLVASLNVGEFEAVLAHEFGHFHSGDTTLGPWVYKTRAAIIRTILASRVGWMRNLFVWYARLFLRITYAVSRRQELVADRLAARVSGTQALASALRKLAASEAAFRPYWTAEVSPVLEVGFAPPIAEGFQQFLSAPMVHKLTSREVAESLNWEVEHPYDTHPPIRERLAAIADLPMGPLGDETPALSLIDRLEEQERRLLAHVLGKADTRHFERLAWSDVPKVVIVARWERMVGEYAEALRNRTASEVPVLLSTFESLRELIRRRAKVPLTAEAIRKAVQVLLSSALALALVRNDWLVQTAPGERIVLRRGEQSLDIGELFSKLAAGSVSAEEWREWCVNAGIGGTALA